MSEDASRGGAPARHQGEHDSSHSEIYRSTAITFDDIVTVDPAMQRVLSDARRVAATDLTVLITGETGTGKNLLAQAIHTSSRRMIEPFISVNCSALAETLLESELFGHEKGAFTGADRERRGKFELAQAGTLFLDEIGDLSSAAQAKILRAIEYRQFERVGGETTLITSSRFIAATNRDLPSLIAEGRFREDAFYRIAEFVLAVPPLRERPRDITLLLKAIAQEFVARFRADNPLAPDDTALTWAAEQPWPGNVRQLRNAVKAAVILASPSAESITADALAATAAHTLNVAPRDSATTDLAPHCTLAEAESRHIKAILAHTAGNKSQAAQLLGITRPTLDRKIKQYGLEV